ncbi:MAG: YceI family protein [Acidobacteria bacterium]|nr:YceI family protein [Acidobacteriota bacterium]MBI3262179.1 YceI family protein [Acidobacteriota bacterium]
MVARVGAISLAVVIVAAGSFAQAQSPADDSAPRFIISGTSTVRAWSCPARGMIKVTPGKSSPPAPGFPQGPQTVIVTVPVKAIECEEKLMIEHLRQALNEKAFPEILYQLEQYTMTGETAKTTGKLTIAGATKPVSFDVRLVPSPKGVRGVGETTIDLTQFGVTPPVIWQGLLKVGKDVRVRFEALLQSMQ